ncbi:polysaccharide biosynthesis protein [halophilic archaeon]|nr:polysaccharide biosynthesis protein [halophilic archaeon]
MKDSITKMASVAFLGGLVGRALRYSLNVIIARGLGTDALGLFAFGMIVMKASGIPARLGLDNAAQKYIPIYQRDDDHSKIAGVALTAVVAPLVVGTAIAGVLYIGANQYASVLDADFGPTTQLFLVGIPLFSVMMVGMSVTRSFKETKYSVYVREFGQSGTAVVLVAVGAFVLNDVRAVIAGYLASLLVGSALAVYYIVDLGAIRRHVSPAFETKKIFTYSLPVVAVAVTQYFISWTDILMLGAFVSPSKVGWYQAAFQTSVLLAVVLQAVNTIFPTLAADFYHDGQHERLERTYTVVTKWVAYLTVLGFLFLVVYDDEILSIFGAATPAATTTLLILGFGQMFKAAIGPAGFFLSMSEYERLEAVNTTLVCLVNVGLNFVLIGEYGIVGAAMATGTSLALLNVLRVGEVYYLLDIHPYSLGYWKGGVAVACATVVMLVGRELAIFDVGKVLVVGTLSLGTFVALMGLLGVDDADRTLLESISD